jgi:hypothetical protein
MSLRLSAACALCIAAGSAGCTSIRALETTHSESDVSQRAHETLLSIYIVRGDELYVCRRSKSGIFGWTALGEEGRLFDQNGKDIGLATPGARWLGTDGSWIAAERTDASYRDANALPWMRFVTTRTSGNGVFGHVSSVTSEATRGGGTPNVACDALSDGAGRLVPFTATLRFFVSPVRR